MVNLSFQKAVELLGSQVSMAKAIGVRQQHVWNWLNETKHGVPAEYCRAIEDATNGRVTRYELRPDIFGKRIKEAA